MSDADIKRFTQLVRESIGLKDDRGDQLNVMNQTFKTRRTAGAGRGTADLAGALGRTSSRKQVVGARARAASSRS